MKTFHELNEAFPSLLDENGIRKPFEQFLRDVQSIDETYNGNWLRAEYNFAGASAEMAARWEDFQEDEDEYYLQYRTAGDDLVRPEHAALHGITLPMKDSFWDTYYPPNGWNCRCTVVQVLKDKYPVTDHSEAMRRGGEALAKDKKGMFAFNPGKQGKTFPDYNPYTLSKCKTCTRKLNLAKDLSENEVCDWCLSTRDHTPNGQERYQANKALYERLKEDENYKNVEFNESSGGVRAEHLLHDSKGKGYSYEEKVVEVGFDTGHAVILGPEPGKEHNLRYTEGTWDGHPFEVAGKMSFSKASVRKGLKHCAAKRVTEYAILYFPNGGFNLDVFENGLRMYNGLEGLGDGQWIQFKKIICIQEDSIILERDL